MHPFKKKIVAPTLYIAPNVNEKVKTLVAQSQKEIAWHGLIERVNESVFIWYDVLLFPQYVTGATTTTDEEEYAMWLNEQCEYNIEQFNQIRLHGHSHVNMAVYPSGTDKQYREDILKYCQDGDFYIFTIWNKKGEIEMELYDTVTDYIFSEKDINIIIGTPDAIKKNQEWAEKVIKKYVKERTYTYKCSTTSNQSNSTTPSELKSQSTLSAAERLELQWRSYWCD